MKKPVINPRENCISCGNCQSVAPTVFRIGADGKAEVINSPDYAPETDAIDRAIRECPVQIISWQE
jgi:ferredoxin